MKVTEELERKYAISCETALCDVSDPKQVEEAVSSIERVILDL